MSKPVSAAEAARRLREADDILILTHQYPDGDTLGSGFSRSAALRALGKAARWNAPTPSRRNMDICMRG